MRRAISASAVALPMPPTGIRSILPVKLHCLTSVWRRLEFGLGSAYQREFDRMKPGLDQKDSWQYMQEMLPIRELWKGDVAHEGQFWQFPKATSCPKPLQDMPMWVAARSPITFDYAVRNNCNILSWPLTLPFSEAEKYRGMLDASIANHNPDWSGRFCMMRHAGVYETEADRDATLAAIRQVLAQFGNLMLKKGDVIDSFPEAVRLLNLREMSGLIPKALRPICSLAAPIQSSKS